MANNPLEIKILASLDQQLSTDEIKQQLLQISKKLDINVGVDMDVLNKVVKQVEKIQKQIAKNQPSVLNVDQEKKNAQAILNTVEAVKAKIKKDSTNTGTFKY
ncbi:hypothetical protein [Terrilactibacillus laevilacticus]|uniref:hypothetical protein n=1 Tax=Terrilactibacillus laevilacticus TaxID=1380157 RepID=UPI0011462A11|nr:hypothetical protein [Terrilactibacillus laevilacticus]